MENLLPLFEPAPHFVFREVSVAVCQQCGVCEFKIPVTANRQKTVKLTAVDAKLIKSQNVARPLKRFGVKQLGGQSRNFQVAAGQHMQCSLHGHVLLDSPVHKNLLSELTQKRQDKIIISQFYIKRKFKAICVLKSKNSEFCDGKFNKSAKICLLFQKSMIK